MVLEHICQKQFLRIFILARVPLPKIIKSYAYITWKGTKEPVRPLLKKSSPSSTSLKLTQKEVGLDFLTYSFMFLSGSKLAAPQEKIYVILLKFLWELVQVIYIYLISVFLILRFGLVDKIKTANWTKPCGWVKNWSEYIRTKLIRIHY